MAYLLSAVAALIYIVAAVGLARAGHTGRRVALACCSVELAGVVGVGVLSLVDAELFPDETVWSGFGSGYGYIPLVLPVLGLLWLWRTRTAHRFRHRRPHRRLTPPSGRPPDRHHRGRCGPDGGVGSYRVSPAGRRRRR